jgi:uncharacterized membrane protein YqgA involved in biofilm formation
MTGLGTLVNAAAIIIGTSIGFFAKGKIPKRFQNIVMQVIGLTTIFIGISGVLTQMLTYNGKSFSTQYTMNMLLYLVAGAIIGELINIEKRLDTFAAWCKRKFRVKNDKENLFVDGLVSSFLLFCVGAMSIIGSIEDGLNHNYSILFTKSIMDGISSIVFSVSLGVGVYFSIIPLIIYQGSITLLAKFVSPYLTDVVISQMSIVGNVIIFALGINLVFGKKIKVANLIPGIFLPIIIGLF